MQGGKKFGILKQRQEDDLNEINKVRLLFLNSYANEETAKDNPRRYVTYGWSPYNTEQNTLEVLPLEIQVLRGEGSH